MKTSFSFLLAYFVLMFSSYGQDHPFEYLIEVKSKPDLIEGVVNAIEFSKRSPNLKFDELRSIISNNDLFTEKEKQSLLLLVDADDRNLKREKSRLEYYNESIQILSDSSSLIHAYISIKKAEGLTLSVVEGYEAEVNNVLQYRSKDYPSWLHGYLYFTLSLNALQSNDFESFTSLADTASLNLAKNKHFSMQGLLYHSVGDELYFRGVDTAYVYFEKALELELEHKLDYLRMRTLTQLAGVDRYAEDYESCVEKQYQVIDLAEELKDTSFIIEGNMRLSVTMSAQGGKQYIEAIKVLEKAKDLALKIGDEGRYARSFGYLGGVYLNMREYRKAINNFKKSIDLNKDNRKDKLIVTYLELAACYLEIGDTDSTYMAVMKSNEYSGGRNPYYQQYGEMILTDYYIENNQLNKAINGAKMGLEMAGDYDKSMKSTALSQLMKIHESKGNYKKAYNYFKEFYDVEKLLSNDDLSVKISEARLEADYEADKKILLANNEKEKAIAEAKQTQFMYLAGLAAIVAAFLAGLYFLSKRKNRIIEDQNEELQILNNVKDQLFQIIGHDLRKPALAFRNVSSNLNYLIDKGDTKRMKLLGEEIDQEGKNLFNLTDNLLHWALLQKDLLSIKPTRIEVRDAVAENIELFQSAAKFKGVQLINDVEEKMSIQADRNSLDTILRNLIDNAIKYSSQEGSIKISASHNGSLIDLSISDVGVGMTSQEVNQILDGTLKESKMGTANEKGSGLGMKIVKSMINKNSGFLDVKSTRGDGTTFVVSLPTAI